MRQSVYETVREMMPTGQPKLVEDVQSELDALSDQDKQNDPIGALRYAILLRQLGNEEEAVYQFRYVRLAFPGKPAALIAARYLEEMGATLLGVTRDYVSEPETPEPAEGPGRGRIEAPILPWATVWNGPQTRERIDVNLNPVGSGTNERFLFRFYDPLYHAPDPIFERGYLTTTAPDELPSRRIFTAFVKFMEYVGGGRRDSDSDMGGAWRRDHAPRIASYAERYDDARNGYYRWKSDNQDLVQRLDPSEGEPEPPEARAREADEIRTSELPVASTPWFTVWNGPGAERVDLKTERYVYPPGAQTVRVSSGVIYAFRFYDPSFQTVEPMFEDTGIQVPIRDVDSEQVFNALVTLLVHLGYTEDTAPDPNFFNEYTERQIEWRDAVAEHIAEIASEYSGADGYEKWKADNEEIVRELDEVEESYVGLDPYETRKPILLESHPGIPVTKLYERGISKGPPKKEENRGTYIWRVEDWDVDKEYGDQPIEMKACYSIIDDSYIGDSKFANQLKKRGIVPQSHSDNDVASIGFSEKEQKWYGWSHRAIYGFGIGDKVKEGDITATSGWTDEYLKDHTDDKPLPVGFKAKTLADAKKMAVAFASAVS